MGHRLRKIIQIICKEELIKLRPILSLLDEEGMNPGGQVEIDRVSDIPIVDLIPGPLVGDLSIPE